MRRLFGLGTACRQERVIDGKHDRLTVATLEGEVRLRATDAAKGSLASNQDGKQFLLSYCRRAILAPVIGTLMEGVTRQTALAASAVRRRCTDGGHVTRTEALATHDAPA